MITKFGIAEQPRVRPIITIDFRIINIQTGWYVKKPRERKRRLRDPQRTRGRLLQAAFREVYRSCFQSAGLDTILTVCSDSQHRDRAKRFKLHHEKENEQ